LLKGSVVFRDPSHVAHHPDGVGIELGVELDGLPVDRLSVGNGACKAVDAVARFHGAPFVKARSA
jgi:hypothetical protein